MTCKPNFQLDDALVPRSVLANSEFGGLADGAFQRGTLIVRDGRIRDLIPSQPSMRPVIVIPKLTEAHCHLDKCHTIARLETVGGDLLAAIAAQGRDKDNWTQDDLTLRAGLGLQDCVRAGCHTVRSHIDWGTTSSPPLAWEVLPQLPGQTVTRQWAALTGIDQMADPDFASGVAKAVSNTSGGVLGSFILHHSKDGIRRGLRECIAHAERFDLSLDFHVDESLEDLDGVEMIADAVLETGHQGPVLCGHAVSLSSKREADFQRIAEKLALADITICALPTTNLYLQGRAERTPQHRGMTRLRELARAGVRVIVGSDNVQDAFCPLGQHDPMAALHLACLAAHLDPPLDRLLPMITTDARTALGLPPITVDGAAADDLLVYQTASIASVVSGHCARSTSLSDFMKHVSHLKDQVR